MSEASRTYLWAKAWLGHRDDVGLTLCGEVSCKMTFGKVQILLRLTLIYSLVVFQGEMIDTVCVYAYRCRMENGGD